ncbi:hypothetical protein BDV93DRAFT_581824 [Ceratobasidium sp. AG-I]|nr:hypothetical protein BDV93DRAFT_581824 [Ceratobasidium sp. AG-I]
MTTFSQTRTRDLGIISLHFQATLDPPHSKSMTSSSAEKAPMSQNTTMTGIHDDKNTERQTSKKSKMSFPPGDMASNGLQAPKDAFFSLNYISLDIFSQAWLQLVASNLLAVDVLNLARTSKLFRKILMSCSSLKVWRVALSNSNLPPCENTVSEPKYTAMMFEGLCASCGTKPVSPYYHPNKAMDQLPEEMQPLFRKIMELARNNVPSSQGIAASGNRDKPGVVESNKVHATNQNLSSSTSRQLGSQQQGDQAKAEMLRKRHAEIKQRLKALGWTERDMVFPKRTQKQWLGELNHNTPCTEKHWGRIKGRLVALLETNRATRPVWEREERRDDRRDRLNTLWAAFKTELSSQTGSLLSSHTLAEAGLAASRLFPVPEFSDAVEWPIIKELIEKDASLTETNASFTRSWCDSVKTTLADVVRQGFDRNDYTLDTPIVGTIAGDPTNNPFSGLSPEIQLFLRADSLFDDTDSPRRGDLPFCVYEKFIQSVRQYCKRDFSLREKSLDTTTFRCHSTAPAITRALLKSLGRPTNTSILELQALDERFVCGRCDDNKPKAWLEMVEYYINQDKRFKSLGRYWFIDHGIALHNLHALESDNAKPLIRIVSAEEQLSMANVPVAPDKLYLMCGPCLRSRGSMPEPFTRAQLAKHLLEAHELTDPELEDPNADVWGDTNKRFRVVHLDSIREDGHYDEDHYEDEEGWWNSGSEEDEEEDENQDEDDEDEDDQAGSKEGDSEDDKE